MKKQSFNTMHNVNTDGGMHFVNIYIYIYIYIWETQALIHPIMLIYVGSPSINTAHFVNINGQPQL